MQFHSLPQFWKKNWVHYWDKWCRICFEKTADWMTKETNPRRKCISIGLRNAEKKKKKESPCIEKTSWMNCYRKMNAQKWISIHDKTARLKTKQRWINYIKKEWQYRNQLPIRKIQIKFCRHFLVGHEFTIESFETNKSEMVKTKEVCLIDC